MRLAPLRRFNRLADPVMTIFAPSPLTLIFVGETIVPLTSRVVAPLINPLPFRDRTGPLESKAPLLIVPPPASDKLKSAVAGVLWFPRLSTKTNLTSLAVGYGFILVTRRVKLLWVVVPKFTSIVELGATTLPLLSYKVICACRTSASGSTATPVRLRMLPVKLATSCDATGEALPIVPPPLSPPPPEDAFKV